nr:hydroxyacid dehydrogenase [uncultured Roseibium sp.]
MKKVVVSEFMDEAALEAFGPSIEIRYDPSLVDDPERLRLELAQADALIVRNRTRVDLDLLNAAPRLCVVGRLGVGLENIDLDACAEKGVAVRPATGANTQSVVEYVIGAMLVLRRSVFASSDDVLAGAWPRTELGAGGEVCGQVLGLVGFGAIAQAVSKAARALGMRIAAFDPYLTPTDPAWSDVRSCGLEELLALADVLSLHVPLTQSTRNLIDADALSKVKPGALLINTARGGVVDERALAEALKTGRLAGAALDVFATEPLDASTAAIFEACPNLILTPHVAGVTEPANARVSQVTVENVLHVLTDGRT